MLWFRNSLKVISTNITSLFMASLSMEALLTPPPNFGHACLCAPYVHMYIYCWCSALHTNHHRARQRSIDLQKTLESERAGRESEGERKIGELAEPAGLSQLQEHENESEMSDEDLARLQDEVMMVWCPGSIPGFHSRVPYHYEVQGPLSP